MPWHRFPGVGVDADGGGLYLQISAYDTKAWIYRFTLDGTARQMGLGPLHTVTLAEAREAAREYPTAPLVSYQINRQLSGWHLPPLVFRAVGAHCRLRVLGRLPLM